MHSLWHHCDAGLGRYNKQSIFTVLKPWNKIGTLIVTVDLRYLEGKRFCVVLAQQTDVNNPDSEIRLRCLHGRANVSREGALSLEGNVPFQVPASAYTNVLPSDGTDMLRDAEYFVICRVSGMDL